MTSSAWRRRAGRQAWLKTRPVGPGLRRVLVILLGSAMLLWSAVVNGRPPVFADTALYYSQAEYLAGALGLVSPADRRVPPGDPTDLPHRPGAANVSITIDRARSPVYGAFLYGFERLGGLWLVAAAQAGMVALSLHLLFRAAAPGLGDRWFLLWLGLISAATSAPFFTSYIMPDVFGGIAGAAALLILVYWDRLSRSDRLAAFMLLVFAVAVHRANLPVVLSVTLASAPVLAWIGVRRGEILARLAAAAGATGMAMIVVGLAFVPIARRAGGPIHDPPFLMSRVLADGPGWRYLQFACAHGQDLALCRFRRLPQEDSDTLLWSNRPVDGLFGVADYRMRLRLEAEERRFVCPALAFDPLGQLRASTRNVLQQLSMVQVQSPLADPVRYVDDGYWRRTSLMRIIPGARTCMVAGRCASKTPDRFLAALRETALLSSLVALAAEFALIARARAFRVGRRSGARHGDDQSRSATLIILIAVLVLANAVICGALSAPVPRYQARLIWLAPALAMLIGATLVRCKPPIDPGRGRSAVEAIT